MSNVVFLAFKNDELKEEFTTAYACSNCNNKTYTITSSEIEGAPVVHCAYCKHEIGKMGWRDK